MTTDQPRTARGRATRERILAGATALVNENGVAATSLDEVRHAAGVSKSQLYLYFSDRDELLRAVARRTSDEVIDGQAESLGGFRSRAGIRAYLDTIVDLQVEREAHGGCPIGSLAGQLAEGDEGARRELAEGMTRWERGLGEGLAAMAESGELIPGTDPAKLAGQVLALIQGGLLLTQIHRDPAQMRRAADGVIALIGGALAPAP